MSCFVGSPPECALHETILLRCIRRHQLASDPDVVAVFHDWLVRIVCSVVTAESTTARMATVFLSLSTNITTYRDLSRDAGKGSVVSMCTSSIGLLARAVV